MNPKQTSPPPPAGISLDEIYYILFRRKWVILGFSLLGFIAAGLGVALVPLMALSPSPHPGVAVRRLKGIQPERQVWALTRDVPDRSHPPVVSIAAGTHPAGGPASAR